MALPPSLLGLTTDTSRDTAGPCLDTPPLSASLGWASIAMPAHPGTSLPAWGRNCSLRAAVTILPCVACSMCWQVSRFHGYFHIYNGILPLSRKITLLLV